MKELLFSVLIGMFALAQKPEPTKRATTFAPECTGGVARC